MRADWPSENIILGLLCERPMHGYELARLVQEDEALRAIWRIERSEIYFLLGKLQQKGVHCRACRRAAQRAGAYDLCADRQRSCRFRSSGSVRRNCDRATCARRYWRGSGWRSATTQPMQSRLIDAQERTLSDWLDQAQEQQIENEVVALVHQLRQAQVRGNAGRARRVPPPGRHPQHPTVPGGS